MVTTILPNLKKLDPLLQIWKDCCHHDPPCSFSVGQLKTFLIRNHSQHFPWLLHLQGFPHLVSKSFDCLFSRECFKDHHQISNIITCGHCPFLITSNLPHLFNLTGIKTTRRNYQVVQHCLDLGDEVGSYKKGTMTTGNNVA